MTQKTKIIGFVLILMTFITTLFAQAQAQNAQDTLNQYISDLQKNPTDQTLREKIIKLAREMKPVPGVPEEAQRFMVRGTAAVKIAKSEQDFSDAVAEFEKATLAAPWLANAYYNLGVAQDNAGQYASAIKSLKLYLLAEPNASDTKEVKTLIYKIEYRQEKAAKDSSSQAIAAQQQNKDAELIKSLDGARYTYQDNGSGDLIIDYALDIRRTILVWSSNIRHKAPNVIVDNPVGVWVEEGQMQIVGHQADFSKPGSMPATFTINEDGKSVTCVQGMGTNITWVFYREK